VETILIIDDHPLMRQGLAMTMQSLSPSAEVCEASDINEALQIAMQRRDVVLAIVDLRLPMIDGLAGLTLLRQCSPQTKLVVMSAQFGPEDVAQARARGADGFLPKNLSSDDVLRALRSVLAGESCFPDGSLGLPPEPMAHTTKTPLADAAPVLTDRQMQVLALLVQGKPNKIIGDELGMAPGTVKIHISSVLRALKVTNRTQAVLAAGRWGLKL